jgi:hypothetical protein
MGLLMNTPGSASMNRFMNMTTSTGTNSAMNTGLNTVVS